MGKRVSMRDIARELGVSAVSVSKALSGQLGVSDAMRERIGQKAHEMGYQYESVTKRPIGRDVGILIPNRFGGIGSSFYATLCQRVVQRLTEMKCYGVMEILREKDEVSNVCPGMVSSGRVDGLIILGQVQRDYIRMLESECPVPYICLDFYDERSTAGAVTSDSLYGTYRLTSHLIHMGHTRIAFLGTIKATSSIMDRYLGYYRSMLQHDLPIQPEWLIPDRDERGLDIEYALPSPLPSAIVCNCDLTAVKLIHQLQREGISVPDDVSVVGFDDYMEAASPITNLTTYAVDLDGMARQAAEMIVNRLTDNSQPVGRTVVSGKIIYRDSVAKYAE